MADDTLQPTIRTSGACKAMGVVVGILKYPDLVTTGDAVTATVTRTVNDL